MVFGRPPVRVEPFFGFRGTNRLTLTARALRAREATFSSRNFLGDLRTMLRQYLSREVAGLAVELNYSPCEKAPICQTVTTDGEGYARFDVPLPDHLELPQRTRWETATLRWQDQDGGGKLIETTAQILAPGSAAASGVISDIDDTIMETGITGSLRAIARNWKRILIQMPDERLLVPGAQELLSALGGCAEYSDAAHFPTSRRPVFYVSSSPWNLFSYLVTFKRQRGFPVGPIMLRDWGLNRRTLGTQGHGSHKLESVTQIVDRYPDLRFALVGDDTQRDLMAFAKVAAAQPERVLAVFIRAVAKQPLGEAALAARRTIEQAGVPFWMGPSFEDALDFLDHLDIE